MDAKGIENRISELAQQVDAAPTPWHEKQRLKALADIQHSALETPTKTPDELLAALRTLGGVENFAHALCDGDTRLAAALEGLAADARAMATTHASQDGAEGFER